MNSSASEEEEAIEVLRHALRELSNRGLSYHKFIELLDDREEWSESALKQFARRETKVRITPKVRDLAAGLVKVSENHRLARGLLDAEQITTLDILIPRGRNQNHPTDPLISEIDTAFLNFKRSASFLNLPPELIFARFGRNRNKIIIVRVSLLKEEDSWVFSMRISGAGAHKRVIIGDVRRTSSNTYFMGVAYSVSAPMSESDFAGLDPFDLKGMKKLISKNSLGIEMFSISNNDLFFPLVPTCFTGLDGAGFPYSGLGLLIDPRLQDALEIPPADVSSSVSCAEEKTRIAEALQWIKGSTLVMPDGAAHALQTKAYNSDFAEAFRKGWH